MERRRPRAEPEVVGDDKPVPDGVKELQAVYVDTWYYNYTAGGLRLTFGEDMDDSTQYRAAIFLQTTSVKQLIRGLTRTLAQMEEMAKADKEAKSEDAAAEE